MRLGFGLLHGGSSATPDNIVKFAKRAESLGYDSLYVIDRVLWPISPQVPYPASADGKLPEQAKTIVDPLETLAFVAAHTSRVRLGTSVINLPYYNPVLLTRQLTAIDVLSKGRLVAGFGVGWSPDEFEAVGTSMKDRCKRANEALRVMKAIWTTDPVEFKGNYYSVRKSVVYPKPVQKPHPPILIAAFTPEAMRRVARYGDAWNPVAIPVAGMAQMFGSIKKMAEEAGRDPSKLELVVRAHPYFSPKPLGDDRSIFAGSADQIRADIAATRKLGAHELFFDVQFLPGVNTLERNIEMMEQLWDMASKA